MIYQTFLLDIDVPFNSERDLRDHSLIKWLHERSPITSLNMNPQFTRIEGENWILDLIGAYSIHGSFITDEESLAIALKLTFSSDELQYLSWSEVNV